jgi:hypothetical protein
MVPERIKSTNTKNDTVSHDRQLDIVLPALTDQSKLEKISRFYRGFFYIILFSVGAVFGYFSYSIFDRSGSRRAHSQYYSISKRALLSGY